MKIKDYLEILDKLPQTPFHQTTIDCTYLDEGDRISNDFINNNFNSHNYKTLRFNQERYFDTMKRVKYRWKVDKPPNIDYKVDSIYIKTSNDLIFATLIHLAHKYKFKNWTTMASNMKSCYIDFRTKTFSIFDSKTDKFYYVEDEEIIEKIFYNSVKEYPNGIPLIWDDF